MTRPHTFMEPELFKKVVDEVSSYDVRTWLHFMGEPLMHPHIFELIAYASSKKLPYREAGPKQYNNRTPSPQD